jgi:tRNA-modifying protein YgfZ
MDSGLEQQVRALDAARAHVRPSLRSVLVSGNDARSWLNDLVTAGIDRLDDGASVRSLLLSATGRIRAELLVVRRGDEYVLVQTPDQPDAVDAVLAPYVLSSAVELVVASLEPVLVPAAGGWRALLEPPAGSVEVDARAGDRWRIERGIARFPIDLDTDSLPAEAGLDAPPVTDTAKGCFLGQESVARVRNLGHPTRVVVALAADAAVTAGTRVTAAGDAIGTVTSATAAADGGTLLLARVRWDARERPLETPSGVSLRPR